MVQDARGSLFNQNYESGTGSSEGYGSGSTKQEDSIAMIDEHSELS